VSFTERLRKARRELILEYLVQANWCVREAAKAAGRNRPDFYKMMRREGISLPAEYRMKPAGNQAWRDLQ
jgi:transcriptional regulator of acetoin/glycerol metabolism